MLGFAWKANEGTAQGFDYSAIRVPFTDEEIGYLIDSVMVFMNNISALDYEDHRLPELQQLLIKLMFTEPAAWAILPQGKHCASCDMHSCEDNGE